MFNLILVTNMALMGTYADLKSCNDAIYQITAQKIAPYPESRNIKEVEAAIRLQVKYQTALICVPSATNK